MKRQDLKTHEKHSFNWFKDQAWTLGLAFLWVFAVNSRNFLIKIKCSTGLDACSPIQLPSIDRPALGLEIPEADGYSFVGQNLSGLVGFLVPVLWILYLYFKKRKPFLKTVQEISQDVGVILQTVVVNGLLTEISHLIVQRPRPFVYVDPLILGADNANYTSFYSGHTSFSAAVLTSAFLILIHRNAPYRFVIPFLLLAESLVISTGFFRILAGRHFLTDVLCGAMAGTLVAWFIFKINRNKYLVGP